MDLGLTDEQQQLVESFAGLLAKQSSPAHVRAAEPLGFDAQLWRSLGEVGAVAMAVDEAAGGWGASVVDLALVAEQVGGALAPAPVVEVQVAARLLAATPGADAAAVLSRVLDGELLVTAAVRPAVGATATLVPVGAVADRALVWSDDRLVLVPAGRVAAGRVDNLGTAPLADLTIGEDAVVLATGDAAAVLYDRAIDTWLALTAATLVGLAGEAHRITCAYACERHAWGVPIGSFQGVSHPLADAATAIDGARLLARKAAWAMDVDDARRAELAAMAFAFAAETARDATYQAIHFHGGYGFMLESDPQLFYRRARAWARVWGEPAAAYRRAARARYAEAVS